MSALGNNRVRVARLAAVPRVNAVLDLASKETHAAFDVQDHANLLRNPCISESNLEGAVIKVKMQWPPASKSCTEWISHTGNQSMAPSSCLSPGKNLLDSTGNDSFQCNHSLLEAAKEFKLRIGYGGPEADARDTKPKEAGAGICLPKITARALKC